MKYAQGCFGDDYFARHLYRGAVRLSNGNKLHVWQGDVEIAQEDKRETSWEEAEDYLQFICEKYQIFGPETGEITFEQLPGDVSATYEEVVETAS